MEFKINNETIDKDDILFISMSTDLQFWYENKDIEGIKYVYTTFDMDFGIETIILTDKGTLNLICVYNKEKILLYALEPALKNFFWIF